LCDGAFSRLAPLVDGDAFVVDDDDDRLVVDDEPLRIGDDEDAAVVDDEETYVNATGNPGMATAGAGDVLAGVLVAYLARLAPFAAAAAAVHVHGRAGDLAAARLGEAALVASDLIEALPAAQTGGA